MSDKCYAIINDEVHAVEAIPADVMQPRFEGNPADCAIPQAIRCYVILRDTPDIVALPSNTYSAILECGTLEVLTDDKEENQVALFAPNSWVAYVNKETDRAAT